MDVDIDFADKKFENHFDFTRASMVKNDELVKHNVGVYFQYIPVDMVTGLAAIPYKIAEDIGFMKLDFLHLDLLKYFENNEQIEKLANVEPDWTLLEYEENVKKLFQLGKQFELVSKVKPTSIVELADCLAIMRPGKFKLREPYIMDKVKTRPLLYEKSGKFSFKRSHAIAYATTIVLQLHLLKAGII